MNAIRKLEFEDSAVRMLVRDDEPWWVLTDVCTVLEIGNSRQASTRLDSDEKDGVIINDAMGRAQEMTIINESGLYSLILTSRKAAARRFKKWVTSVVLPELRRTGRYVMGEAEADAMPVAADGKVFGVRIAKANAAARLIAVANSIYGPEAARALWEFERDLPRIARRSIHVPEGEPDADPADCLRHLLDAEMGDGRTVRERLRLAIADKAAAKGMDAFGIVPSPPMETHCIAIADQNRFLAAVFSNTQWNEHWRLALVKLPGAKKSRVGIMFDGVRRIATLVPKARVADQL
ncbi:BRO-N domain-containing protein [Pelagibacterium lentulum]|uniref:Bro-N domain-containing protein n=1 Tax=Pelagibacterium lentulum TaxID=2029865 RepID=A0A916RNK2_9HYPH|nr:BRO family protein [Pelagibacterium lentulum]GGA63908.1 hypothetical protein GCM10011499_37890 [Pelagibacterium lentulum]